MTDLMSELRLTVTQCFHSTVRTDWRGRDQADGDTRIYLPLRGRAELSWAGRRFRLQPGRCFLIPAHRPRTFSCSGRLELWWTHCQLKLWGGVDAWRYLQAVGEIEADLGVWHARFADLARYWRDSTPAGV
jgi:hypothetical protein